MRDIKIKQPLKYLNSIKKEAQKENKTAGKSSSLPFVLFTFMSVSVFLYIYFMTSIFYFAIEERQILMKKNNIAVNELANILEENKNFLITEKTKSDRISYINTTQNSSISLK